MKTPWKSCENWRINYISIMRSEQANFDLASPSEMPGDVARRIMDYFDGGGKKFYNKEDAAAGCISSADRKGAPRVFPIMSISMAGVDLSRGVYNEYIEVNDAGADLKKEAKAEPGSFFSMGRRGKTGDR